MGYFLASIFLEYRRRTWPRSWGIPIHPWEMNAYMYVCIVRLGKLCGRGTIPTFEKSFKNFSYFRLAWRKKNPPSNRSQQTCTHDGASATFSFPFIWFIPTEKEEKENERKKTVLPRFLDDLFCFFDGTCWGNQISTASYIYNKVEEEKCLKSLWLARGLIFLLDPYHVSYCIVLASKKKSLLSFPDGPRSVPVVRWEVVVGSS